MIVETKCQFCQKPLRLIVDEDYGGMGDPNKLYRLAACDSCADYRQRRRQTFGKLKWICELLATNQVHGDEELARVRKNLKTLLMRYIVNLAKHRGQDPPDWDEAILEGLMNRPASLGSVLGTIAGMIKQERLL